MPTDATSEFLSFQLELKEVTPVGFILLLESKPTLFASEC